MRNIPPTRCDTFSSPHATPNANDSSRTAHDEIDKAELRSEHVLAFKSLVERHAQQLVEKEAEKRQLRCDNRNAASTARQRQDDLEAEKQSLVEKRERMRQAKAAAEMRLDRVRDAQAGRMREEAELDAAQKGLEREIQELRDTHERLKREKWELRERSWTDSAVLSRNIERLQRYAPSFALPLEVIVTIAGFLAGSNYYGTLASLCVCSQLVQQECQATLYETVVCNDYWNEEFRRCSAPPSLVPETWKYIQFIVLDSTYHENYKKVRYGPFRGVRVAIIRDMQLSATVLSEWSYSRHTAEMVINHDASITTLSSIFQYSFDWKHSDGSVSRSPICGISNLTIWGHDGSILRPADSNAQGVFQAPECGPYYVFVSECTNGLAKEPERMETCIQAVSQLAMRAGIRRHIMDLQCDEFPESDAWLRQVASFSTVSPFTTPRLGMFFGAEVTAQRFVDYAHAFEAVYKSIWMDVYARIEQDITTETTFFELQSFCYVRQDHDNERFGATFTRILGRSGFHVTIAEYGRVPEEDDDDDDDEEESPTRTVTVLDDHHYTPLEERLGDTGNIMDDSDNGADRRENVEMSANAQ